MISPKLVPGIIQVGIVKNCKKTLDEDKDYFKRKHNLGMPWIIPTTKLYHDQKGRPSMIGNASRLFIDGRTIFINNGNGGPFGGGDI